MEMIVIGYCESYSVAKGLTLIMISGIAKLNLVFFSKNLKYSTFYLKTHTR